MEELLKEALRLIKGSVALQDAYTARQEKETGIIMDVYLMPDEKEFIRKAEKFLSQP